MCKGCDTQTVRKQIKGLLNSKFPLVLSPPYLITQHFANVLTPELGSLQYVTKFNVNYETKR